MRVVAFFDLDCPLFVEVPYSTSGRRHRKSRDL